jgi:serine phosphatase RsbU (regulator of sigma subunit)
VLKHRLDRLAPAVDRALREAAERTELKLAELEKERLIGELAVAYEREHRIAETLQRSFMNKLDPGRFPNLDLATIYQAAWDEAQVGGDYYDYFPLPNGRIAIVVGDVSGKGLNAAERTAELKYTLRAYLREHDSPSVAVSRLNEFLCESFALDIESQDYFVVFTLAVVDPSANKATVVIAGAEPILIIRPDGTTDEAKAGGLPLGIVSRAAYSSMDVGLADGDILILSTDGLTEARCGAKLLGLSGLADIASKCITSPSLSEMGDSILSQTRHYAGGRLQDDACLLLARIKSPS